MRSQQSIAEADDAAANRAAIKKFLEVSGFKYKICDLLRIIFGKPAWNRKQDRRRAAINDDQRRIFSKLVQIWETDTQVHWSNRRFAKIIDRNGWLQVSHKALCEYLGASRQQLKDMLKRLRHANVLAHRAPYIKSTNRRAMWIKLNGGRLLALLATIPGIDEHVQDGFVVFEGGTAVAAGRGSHQKKLRNNDTNIEENMASNSEIDQEEINSPNNQNNSKNASANIPEKIMEDGQNDSGNTERYSGVDTRTPLIETPPSPPPSSPVESIRAERRIAAGAFFFLPGGEEEMEEEEFINSISRRHDFPEIKHESFPQELNDRLKFPEQESEDRHPRSGMIEEPLAPKEQDQGAFGPKGKDGLISADTVNQWKINNLPKDFIKALDLVQSEFPTNSISRVNVLHLLRHWRSGSPSKRLSLAKLKQWAVARQNLEQDFWHSLDYFCRRWPDVWAQVARAWAPLSAAIAQMAGQWSDPAHFEGVLTQVKWNFVNMVGGLDDAAFEKLLAPVSFDHDGFYALARYFLAVQIGLNKSPAFMELLWRGYGPIVKEFLLARPDVWEAARASTKGDMDKWLKWTHEEQEEGVCQWDALLDRYTEGAANAAFYQVESD